MAFLLTHATAFVVVNAFLVFVWLALGGDREVVDNVGSEPVQAVRDGFWPGWVIASWGVLLALHAGSWLAFGVFGRRARHRRRAIARSLTTHALRKEAWVRGVARSTTASDGPRFVAVMFTDIARSTELAEELGDEAWSRALRQHREQVRTAIAAHGGTEVGTQGDGFLVRFDRPAPAVDCAVAIQQATAKAEWPGKVELEVRIGIHAGEAVAAGDDLVGRVINLAYRVAAAASAGEILVTEQVADHVTPGVTVVDRGLRELKGVTQPRHLLGVSWGSAPQAAADAV